MAMNSSARTELPMAKKWRDREMSPERTKGWVEHRSSSDRKLVPVVYYLSRNGHLQHPHFMEVPLSSSLQGLSLKDVTNRLDFLRGNGMASLYSWASKRSYRNGFVWQDLSENDIIHPVRGHEYVLKGSELLESPSSFRSYKPPPAKQDAPELNDSGEGCESPVIMRMKNQSWSSFDAREYKVYKTESDREAAGKATDAATQTDDRRRRRSLEAEKSPEDPYRNSISTAELSREDVSPPPPSSSSTEASEAMIGGGGGGIRSRPSVDHGSSADIRDQTAGNDRPSGRMKAAAVLMQLISCVSGSVNSGGEPMLGKDHKCLETAEYGDRLRRDAWNHGRLGLK